jgi:hypothetical protein
MVWLATDKDLCAKAAPPRDAPSSKMPVFVTSTLVERFCSVLVLMPDLSFVVATHCQ